MAGTTQTQTKIGDDVANHDLMDSIWSYPLRCRYEDMETGNRSEDKEESMEVQVGDADDGAEIDANDGAEDNADGGAEIDANIDAKDNSDDGAEDNADDGAEDNADDGAEEDKHQQQVNYE